ncbi:MAG: 4Fe-4S dicluster domain-containing protein [Syntrophomonadaceae bacterium]|nr:4Fe-4S dicluster domain-containing protein [Syntrophomonadaceae bacterium]
MIFDKAYSLKISLQRCLNQWHQGVECKNCLESCPADAILLYKKQIYLDKESCNGCGVCLNDCPTEVFSSERWDEVTIVKDIEEEGWKVTEFFCARHTTPYNQIKHKNRGAVQLPACLSIISKGGWYELGLKTDMELHLEECEGCPMSKTLSRLEYNIATAAEWLEACGHNPKISFINQSVKGSTKRHLRAIETGLKVTSRRDLFLSLFDKGKQIVERIAEAEDYLPVKEPEQKFLERYLPKWQKRLENTYRENMITAASPAYWPAIKIVDKCVGCQLCSRFCPSGSLKIVTDNETINHCFTSGHCLDCRICELFCLGEAISRNREKIQQPFEVLNIYTASMAKCERCETIASNKSKRFCYWCEKEVVIDNELIENFKKII